MRLRHEMRLAVGALVALQVLTAVVGAWLLLRTAVSIRRILAENDVSLEAVETMRGALDRPPVDDDDRTRFERALSRARDNITEPEEPAHIDAVAAHHEAALAGDAAARAQVLDALNALSAINRASMRRTDAEARRLARAGAWTLIGLALASLGLGLLLVRRSRARLMAPIARLYRVARAWEQDDRRQRCATAAMPDELATVARALDGMLDTLGAEGPPPAMPDGDRAALLALLDRMDRPAGVLLDDGTLRAANRAGMARRGDLRAAFADGAARESLGAAGWLVVLEGEGPGRG